MVKQSASMLLVGQYSTFMIPSSAHSRSLWNAVSIWRVFDQEADAVAHFMADLESSSAGVGCSTGVPRSANRRRNHTMSRPRSRRDEVSASAVDSATVRVGTADADLSGQAHYPRAAAKAHPYPRCADPFSCVSPEINQPCLPILEAFVRGGTTRLLSRSATSCVAPEVCSLR